MQLKKGSKILFQGDSITDAGRSRENDMELGTGYPAMISAYLRAIYPELDLDFINRGISGNRVIDLKNRWKADCIDLKPDLVSILIGINDTWRRFDSDMPTTDLEYEENFRSILAEIKEDLDADILIIEPFLLPINEEQATIWSDDLELKIRKARKLAKEFKTRYIPMDGIFASVCTNKPSSYWAADGVHPTQEGHALIAHNWIKTIK